MFTSSNKFKLRINKSAPSNIYLFDLEYSETVTTTIDVKHKIRFRVTIIECKRPELVVPIDDNVYLVERGTQMADFT